MNIVLLQVLNVVGSFFQVFQNVKFGQIGFYEEGDGFDKKTQAIWPTIRMVAFGSEIAVC